MRRSHGLTIAAALGVLTIGTAAQAPPELETLLRQVGERLEQYYKRAQSVIFSEKRTVQPVGRDFAPVGFARVTEYELRVDSEPRNDVVILDTDDERELAYRLGGPLVREVYAAGRRVA